MPNTKRRFADDDPSDDDYVEEEPIYRGGGKQMIGKQFRRPPVMEDSDEDDDDDESDYEQPIRGAGKQFRPSGGKQLRVFDQQESEEEDDDDDDEPQPVVAVAHRGGGKSLFRPPPQDDSDEDEDDDDDETPIQVSRGAGKGLMGIQQRGGGKQFRPPVMAQEEESDEEEKEEATPMVVTRAPHGGGKQLRQPAPKSESEESDDDDLFGDEDDDDDFDDAMEIDDSSDEEVKKPPPKRRGRPPTKKTPSRAAKTKAAAAAAAQKTVDDESSSSSEEERELDMETFDTQALVENEEDQKYLDSLPEFEREAILGERFEKLKAAADMKKALRESKRKEREAQKKEESAKKKSQKKKKAPKKADTDGDAELAAKLSSARESTRNRDAMGTKAKKDAARARMLEQKRLSQKEEGEEEEEEESDLEFESDEDEDSDYSDAAPKPWQQQKKAQKTSSRLDKDDEVEEMDEEMEDVPGTERAPAVEAELEDYMKVTLPRRRLARWSHEPFFDRAVVGCFVRLFIGEDGDGKKCYRLCEIIGVEKSKSEYKFPARSSREKPISTSKALKLRFGKNEKVFPMYLVSESRPTDEDVKKYVSVQKSSRKDVLGKKQASRLRKKQDELVNNYTYTQADIEKNLAERKKTGKTPTNLGSEQTRVAIAVQAAKSAVEDARRRLDEAKRAHLEASEDDSEDFEKAIKEAEDALAEAKKNLDEKKQEEERVLAVVDERKKKLVKQQNWTKVNARAAKMNQSADFQSYKDQQAKKDAETASGSTPRFNPYARRKVKPKILWEVGQKEEKKDDDATKTVDDETREEAAEGNKGANGKEDQQPNEAAQEDILGSQQKAAFIGERHQFSIDEEALTPDTASILGSSRKKQKVSQTRKGLSLAEYQERKAAGTL